MRVNRLVLAVWLLGVSVINGCMSAAQHQPWR
jgi:hypothetical protein